MAGITSGYVDKATLTETAKGYVDLVYRKNKLLAKLKAMGRISFNHDGKDTEWRVAVRRGRRANRPEGQHAEFDHVDRLEVLNLPWGKIEAFDRLKKIDLLVNKGKSRIVNLLDLTIKGMAADARDFLSEDLITGGTDATIHGPVYGFMSFLGRGQSGVAFPTPQEDSDTYGGKKMALGAYGGSVRSGAWPDGKFDPEYSFNTPLQVNYEHADFGEGATFETNGKTAIRRAIDFQSALRGEAGQPDMFLLAPGLYTLFKDALDDKERIVVNRGDKLSLTSLGFGDVVNFDGVEITKDPLLPQGVGIGLSLDDVEVLSLQGQLFEAQQDFDATDTKAREFTIDFYGQIRWSPYSTILLAPASQYTETA